MLNTNLTLLDALQSQRCVANSTAERWCRLVKALSNNSDSLMDNAKEKRFLRAWLQSLPKPLAATHNGVGMMISLFSEDAADDGI